MPFNEINALRKEGRHEVALAIAEKEYSEAPGKFEGLNLFWCLNDMLKQADLENASSILERMRELVQKHGQNNDSAKKALQYAEHLLSPEGQKEKEGWSLYRQIQATAPELFDERKNLLFKYLKLQLPKPSLLHSLIMAEAIKMSKEKPESFAFSKFAELWGFDSIREEDWANRASRDGHKLPSLCEKIIGEYVREMHADNFLPTEGFIAFLDEAICRLPQNKHLPRYCAQILAKQGRTAEAIEAYKKLLIESSDKFYIWDDLAELIDDPRVKVGLYCGAIMAGANEEFIVNVRLRLAEKLCDMRLYANALNELERYRATHERKGWPLRKKYTNVANRLPRETVAVDNHPLYAEYKSIADDFIFESIPSQIMVKTWEKKEMFKGKSTISWQLRQDENSYWLKPRKFHLDFNSKNGSVFQVKTIDKKIVWIRPSALTSNLSWLKEVSGVLEVCPPQTPNEKISGKIGEVFVPAYVLYGHAPGSNVTAIAILNADGRWTALSIR